MIASSSTAVVGSACKWVWAYRKAAWAIEDLEQDVGLIYRQMGRKGLESIENVGLRLAEVIGRPLNQEEARSHGIDWADRGDAARK